MSGEAAAAFRERMEQRRIEEYLRFFGPVTNQFLDSLAGLAGDGRGRWAVDLGCGDGVLADLLHRRGWRCVALDRSRPMVRLAGERLGTGRAAVADASSIPLRPASVDTVAAAFLVPHLDDPERTFTEIRRVLRPGGRVVVATWGPPDRSPFTGAAMDIIRAHAEPSQDHVFRDLAERGGAERLPLLLRSTGFADVETVSAVADVRLASPEEWWNGLVRGSLGLTYLLQLCPPRVRGDIREEFLRQAAVSAVGGRVTTEAEAVIASAVAV